MAERAPRGEVAVMVAVQSALVDRPGMLATARGLSHFGEHCIGWLILALLGAIALPRRRREWLVAGAGAFVAHAIAVLIKRLVRRQRPDHPAIAVNVDTPSQLSFPSAPRHLDHGRGPAHGQSHRAAATGCAGAADGAVANTAGGPLPQ